MEQDKEMEYRYQTVVNIVAEMILDYFKESTRKKEVQSLQVADPIKSAEYVTQKLATTRKAA